MIVRYSIIDKCQSTTGWLLSGVMSNLAFSTDHRGRGTHSIEFDKSGIAGAGYVSKAIEPVNVSPYMNNGLLSYYVYLSDITDVKQIQLILTTDAFGNSFVFNTLNAELSNGWNHVTHILSPSDGVVHGPIDPNAIDGVQFGIVMNLATDLLADIRLNDIEVMSREKILVV